MLPEAAQQCGELVHARRLPSALIDAIDVGLGVLAGQWGPEDTRGAVRVGIPPGQPAILGYLDYT